MNVFRFKGGRVWCRELLPPCPGAWRRHLLPPARGPGDAIGGAGAQTRGSRAVGRRPARGAVAVVAIGVWRSGKFNAMQLWS